MTLYLTVTFDQMTRGRLATSATREGASSSRLALTRVLLGRSRVTASRTSGDYAPIVVR